MRKYICPICKSQLRVSRRIILSLKGPDNERGLILLSPDVGDYTKDSHPDFKIRKGTKYKVYCPVCHASLLDKEKENLVKLQMEEDGVKYDFYFSNIVGEEVTFRINEHVVENYGYHSDRYKKYFDLPEEYKKYL